MDENEIKFTLNIHHLNWRNFFNLRLVRLFIITKFYKLSETKIIQFSWTMAILIVTVIRIIFWNKLDFHSVSNILQLSQYFAWFLSTVYHFSHITKLKNSKMCPEMIFQNFSASQNYKFFFRMIPRYILYKNVDFIKMPHSLYFLREWNKFHLV